MGNDGADRGGVEAADGGLPAPPIGTARSVSCDAASSAPFLRRYRSASAPSRKAPGRGSCASRSPRTALFRFVRTDYVAEGVATQMVNGCALFTCLRRKPARIALQQAGNRPRVLGRDA